MTEWPLKTLGEVCEVVNGATPKTNVKEYWGGSHAWITPAEMGNLDSPFLSNSRRTLSDQGLAACSATLVPPRTVILSSRAPIGHLVINEVPMATNQGCKSLIPKDGLNSIFLYYYLKANVELLDSLGTGAVFKELSGTQLKTVEIPVPPLEEQKRIVALLDAATARIIELTACYEQARTHANNLFTSALRDALESNSEWPVKTLSQILELSYGKPLEAQDRDDKGSVPVYGANGVKAYSRKSLVAGPSIIVGRKGSAGELNFCEGPFWPLDVTYYVEHDANETDLSFLHYLLSLMDLPSLAKGVKPGINRNDVYALQSTVPPLEEQKKIVSRLDSMRAKTSEMVSAYDEKLTAANNLRQSILKSAFTGEL
jgi:type I restriction enzyme S subunit